MSFSDDKNTALIVKLNRLTSTNQIKWRFDEPPPQLVRGTDNYIPIYFTGKYKNQKFALYSERFQNYDGDRDRYFWNERITLSIIDIYDRIIWKTSEYYSVLYDLLETVRSKTADIEGIFDEILGDD